MRYRRLLIEVESPEEMAGGVIRSNLTESSIRDRTLDELGVDLSGQVLAYGDHRGLPGLREQIVAGVDGLGPEHVLCTPGAAAALFFTATSLLSPQDHALIEQPNYATNLETPQVVGADVERVHLTLDGGFALDVDRLAEAMRPSTTFVSVTTPHNPSGSTLAAEQLEFLVELVERHGCWLLVDETYRDMTHGGPLPMAASLSDRAISVGSMSKTYGLPGLRVGWVVTRHPELAETLLAAKEQVVICGSTLDEAAALSVLERRDELLPGILADIGQRLGTVSSWMADQRDWLEWVEPTGGVVCFPRLRAEVIGDVDEFHRRLREEHGTFVGDGRWFDEDRRHFRLGFGWPTHDELADGLEALHATAASLR